MDKFPGKENVLGGSDVKRQGGDSEVKRAREGADSQDGKIGGETPSSSKLRKTSIVILDLTNDDETTTSSSSSSSSSSCSKTSPSPHDADMEYALQLQQEEVARMESANLSLARQIYREEEASGRGNADEAASLELVCRIREEEEAYFRNIVNGVGGKTAGLPGSSVCLSVAQSRAKFCHQKLDDWTCDQCHQVAPSPTLAAS